MDSQNRQADADRSRRPLADSRAYSTIRDANSFAVRDGHDGDGRPSPSVAGELTRGERELRR